MAIVTVKQPGFISIAAQRVAKSVMLVANAVDQKRRYLKTVQELSELTDHELSDLGISRVEIPAIARKAVQ